MFVAFPGPRLSRLARTIGALALISGCSSAHGPTNDYGQRLHVEGPQLPAVERPTYNDNLDPLYDAVAKGDCETTLKLAGPDLNKRLFSYRIGSKISEPRSILQVFSSIQINQPVVLSDVRNKRFSEGLSAERWAAYITCLIQGGATGKNQQLFPIVYKQLANVESALPNAVPESPEAKQLQLGRYSILGSIDLLLDNGMNVNEVDQESGMPMLHMAILTRNPALIRYLLSKGADKGAKDRFGQSTYWLAEDIDPLREAERAKTLYNQLTAQIEKTKSSEAEKKRAQEIWAQPFDLDGKRAMEVRRIFGLPALPSEPTRTTKMMAEYEASKRRAAAPPAPRSAPKAPESPAPATAEVSLADQAKDTLTDMAADCAKLKVSLEACNHLPFPASLGCEKISRASFGSIVCPF